MPLKRKVKDILIPIDSYPIIGPEATLQEAILCLRGAYCKIDQGFCDETGPRTILVVDHSGALAGVLNFRSLLKVLVPEVTGKLTDRLEALEVSVVYAQAGVEDLDESHEDVYTRIIKNAQVKVKEIMLKNRGHIESDARLLDALKLMFSKKLVVLPVYEKERLVGVVRDADLFLAVADLILS